MTSGDDGREERDGNQREADDPSGEFHAMLSTEDSEEAAVRARPALADRLRAARELFGHLDRYEASEPDPALVDATLARIAAAEGERESRMRVGFGSTAPGLGGERWRDVLALACAAILVLSIGMPILSQMTGRSRDAACGGNLRSLGAGITGYVRDHGGMPIAAGFSPDLSKLPSWSSLRNADNLRTLADRGYCDAGCLCCGSDTSRSGYSYQVPTPEAFRRIQSGERGPLAADRNPVIDLFRGGKAIGTFTMNSPEHGGRGQNVLFTDGSVEFVRSPILIVPGLGAFPAHAENIWVPMGGDRLEDGFDLPRDWNRIDVFLTQ